MGGGKALPPFSFSPSSFVFSAAAIEIQHFFSQIIPLRRRSRLMVVGDASNQAELGPRLRAKQAASIVEENGFPAFKVKDKEF